MMMMMMMMIVVIIIIIISMIFDFCIVTPTVHYYSVCCISL